MSNIYHRCQKQPLNSASIAAHHRLPVYLMSMIFLMMLSSFQVVWAQSCPGSINGVSVLINESNGSLAQCVEPSTN